MNQIAGCLSTTNMVFHYSKPRSTKILKLIVQILRYTPGLDVLTAPLTENSARKPIWNKQKEACLMKILNIGLDIKSHFITNYSIQSI